MNTSFQVPEPIARDRGGVSSLARTSSEEVPMPGGGGVGTSVQVCPSQSSSSAETASNSTHRLCVTAAAAPCAPTSGVGPAYVRRRIVTEVGGCGVRSSCSSDSIPGCEGTW